MSYASLPQPIRHTAETHLTPKQLHVLKLHLAGCGARRISTMLQIHRTTVRDHLRAAFDALEAEGVVSDERGKLSVRPQDSPTRADTPNQPLTLDHTVTGAQNASQQREDAA